jgi:hypothetical protein
MHCWTKFYLLTVFAASSLAVTSVSGWADDGVSVGFAKADITPKVDPAGKAVWIAGYGMGRPAIGVHDQLFARAYVIKTGKARVALAILDLVGLQYPSVRRIREKLEGYNYVLVASTHVHEAPDVIGMWGERILKSGVDPEYIDLIVKQTAQAIEEANKNAVPVDAVYGTINNEELLRDSRLPLAKDGNLRVLKFKSKADGKNVAILLQQNCHPESLADKNQYLTADFNYFAIKALEEKYQCPAGAFSGPVGGLMALPDRIKTDEGKELEDGNFEYAEVYGNKLAKSTIAALDKAEPISLSPIVTSSVHCFIPMDNQGYKLGYRSKTILREAFVWDGDPWAKEMKLLDVRTDLSKRAALDTEVAYIRMGELHVAGIPGEAYPESIYGKFQEPVEPNVDFPDAPLEKPVVDILPGKKILLIGLANDEVGYIIPKRQFDMVPPFAYGRKDRQYGEINSCGPEVAPILYQSLERAVKQAGK